MTELTSTHRVSGTLPEWRLPAVPAVRLMGGLATFVVVLAFFTALTAVLLWPCLVHYRSALMGPPEDNMQDFWNTWYAAVAHTPGHFFMTNLLRFPEGTSLIYHSFAYPQVFAVVALSRVFGTDTGTLVALQNLTLLASFPLAGVGAYYLVRHLAGSAAGGLLGGFVFAFNPAHVAQVLHHAHVSSIEFLPFFVLCYLLALERRSYAWLVLAAAFSALSALGCWYYLFYSAYFLGFQMLYERVRDGAWPRGWHLAAPAICLVLTGAMLSPLLVPMVMTATPAVYDLGANIFVTDLLAYFAFPPQHPFSGIFHGLYDRLYHNWDCIAYLGIANLALLGWYCARTGLARAQPAFYVVLGMLTFALLACGETLHVAGLSTLLPLPDAALDSLPFFANVRTPSRAVVFVYLFLAIGIGFAVAAALRHRGALSRVGLAVVAALILVDFYPANLAATPVACPPGLAVLKADSERDFGVLGLPLGYADENAFMLEQVCHGRPIVGGMTSREMGKTLIYRLSITDLAQQQRQLSQAHVKYILLHKPGNGLYRWQKELGPVARYLKRYRAVYDGPDMMVLRVY
ncbi:MAG TPA: hypothetical protein VKR31_16865 [Rhizomicrobium sp.]|nr:hypothetical protein [Rhizomicrobium sp.]